MPISDILYRRKIAAFSPSDRGDVALRKLNNVFKLKVFDLHGDRKVKRPNMGPAWQHQNRDALNEAHVLFDFFLVPFFLFAMMLLLRF